LQVVYEVDPSTSLIKDENLALVQFMRDRLVTIELFDADSRFHFATCKLPLYELLRQ
jgi:hypothetical protein